MAELTYTESAKFARVSRATIYRHIKEGRVSTKQNHKGQNVIDTSELMRVYGESESYDAPNKTSQRDALKHDENDALVPVLKQQITFLESQLDDSKKREENLHEEKSKLFKMLEKEQEKTKTLMLEYKPSADKEAQPDKWKRLGTLAYQVALIAGLIALIILFALNGNYLPVL